MSLQWYDLKKRHQEWLCLLCHIVYFTDIFPPATQAKSCIERVFLSRSILEVIYNKIAIKIFSFVYFHFEKLQNNKLKLMKWFPRYWRLENELNNGWQHKCEGPGATLTLALTKQSH